VVEEVRVVSVQVLMVEADQEAVQVMAVQHLEDVVGLQVALEDLEEVRRLEEAGVVYN